MECLRQPHDQLGAAMTAVAECPGPELFARLPWTLDGELVAAPFTPVPVVIRIERPHLRQPDEKLMVTARATFDRDEHRPMRKLLRGVSDTSHGGTPVAAVITSAGSFARPTVSTKRVCGSSTTGPTPEWI